MIDSNDTPDTVDDGPFPDPSPWVTRSEERLEVITERIPRERIRFRKVVVTEERTVTVTLRREELWMDREPLTGDAGPTADLPTREGVIDMVLHEERPLVTTAIVPVERVRIEIATVTEDRLVSGTVRKERVVVDGASS